LGVLADRAGNLTEAERHFAAAATTDPRSSSTRNNYGAILLKLGHPREAAAQFEASLRLDRNQPNALINLAQIRFSSGSTQDLRAREKCSAEPTLSRRTSKLHVALVVISLRLNDREGAADTIVNTRRISRTRTTARLAPLHHAPNSAPRCSKPTSHRKQSLNWNAAISAEPSNTDAILRLAKAFLALNDMPSAGRTLEAAVRGSWYRANLCFAGLSL